jgi:AraC-like DNA-binding protein
MILEDELAKNGFSVDKISLGEITFKENVEDRLDELSNMLENKGFELIVDPQEKLIAEIKSLLINTLQKTDHNIKISAYLTAKLNKDYSVLSKIFSGHEGITIEKYLIRLKIEKVKELIQMNTNNFSEIAYELGYAHSSHLARQFKSITGMSMSTYQKTSVGNRQSYDQIV